MLKTIDLKPAFCIGQIVFLITDPEQEDRMITGYIVRPQQIVYYLSKGTQETVHYEMEIATEKNWKK